MVGGIVMKRLEVRFICQSHYKDWEIGDLGYVDGYCRGGDDVPCAIVIVKDRIVMAPLDTIRVVNESEVI